MLVMFDHILIRSTFLQSLLRELRIIISRITQEREKRIIDKRKLCPAGFVFKPLLCHQLKKSVIVQF